MNTAYQLKRSVLFLSLALLSSQYVLAGDVLNTINPQNTNASNQEENQLAVALTSKAPEEQLPNILPTIVLSANQDKTLSAGQISKTSQVGMLGDKDDMDIPFSITSYTSKYIEDQQATSVADALRSEPSVRSVFSRGGIGEYFNIRGLYTQSHELAWNGLFGLLPHNRVPTEFLERVDVFKGTSALLNGMSIGGAVGGVINVVPKRATSEDITRLTTSYKSDSTFGAHIDVGRRFGQHDQFGVRVNALKSLGDTALDGQEENRYLGSAAFDYKGEKFRASLDLYDINEKLDGGQPLMVSFATSVVPKAPDSKLNHQPGSYSHTKTRGAIAHVEYDFAPEWTAFASAGTKRQNGVGVIANNALGNAAQPNGDYMAVSRMNANNTNVDAGELGVRGKFNTGAIKHNVVISANSLDQDTHMGLVMGAPWASNIYQPTRPALIASPPTYTPKTLDTTLTSFAFADTLSTLDDKYQLTLGVRHQNVKSQSYSIFTGLPSSPYYDESAITPMVGFVVKPWDNTLSLYANYIEGLSQGGTITDPSNPLVAEKTFKPYKSKQYEVGTKWDMGKFKNTLSIYQITKNDLAQDANRNYSESEQRNRGIEWTTAGEIVKDIRLLGGVSYLEAEWKKTAGGLMDGNDVKGIPHWQSNLGLEWDVQPVEGLTLTANTIYTGSLYANDTNTQKIPDWFVLDLGGRYATNIAKHNVVFRGGVDNVFDKKHWAGVWNGYVGVGGDPRSYKLSMQIDF